MKDSTKCKYFLIGYVLSTLEFGLVFSFGALFFDLRDKFHTDRTTTAAVQSLLMGVASCFSAVGGILINRLGLHIPAFISSICVTSGFILSFFVTKIWFLLFTVSILAGIGISLSYIISITIAVMIKNLKLRSLCIAIHSTCVPVAGLFYPFLLDVLTTTYGLSGTFLVLGGVFCNSFAFSLMIWLRRDDFIIKDDKSPDKIREENNVTDDNSGGKHLFIKLKEFIKKLFNVRYVCVVIATTMAISTLNGYLDFVFDISEWKGYTKSNTKNMYVIYNTFTILFCLTPGILKQKLNIDTYIYPFVMSIIGVCGSLVIRYSSAFIVYTVGTTCMGAIHGTLSSSIIICAQLVHLEQISVAVGFLETIFGFMSACVGPFFGYIRDSTGTYDWIFPIIAAAQGLSALLFIGDIILRKIKKKN